MTTPSRTTYGSGELPSGSVLASTDGDAVKKVCWGAVIAGAVIALALQLLLTMLGTGIDPLASGDVSPSAAGFGIGAAVWWGVSSLIALVLIDNPATLQTVKGTAFAHRLDAELLAGAVVRIAAPERQVRPTQPHQPLPGALR